jgi:hypothetical protein
VRQTACAAERRMIDKISAAYCITHSECAAQHSVYTVLGLYIQLDFMAALSYRVVRKACHEVWLYVQPVRSRPVHGAVLHAFMLVS